VRGFLFENRVYGSRHNDRKRDPVLLKLEQITASLVNAAIRIYLRHAYDDAGLRDAHAVQFADGLAISDILSQFSREPSTLQSYSLRLGCQWYPHMKLNLSEAYYPGEFVFVVDRHDGFDFSMSGPGYDEWLGTRSRNHHVKLAIEDDWYGAKVPTMRSLRETKLSESDIVRAFSGDRVLIVDNDSDTGAILEMILGEAGIAAVWVSGVADAAQILQDENQHFGLALVDMLLTDGTGLDVIDLIRNKAATQEVPIILVSAMQQSEVKKNDADGYLHKPYSAQQLLKAVKTMLKRRYDGGELLTK